MCRLPLNPQSGEISQGLVVNYATKEKKQKSIHLQIDSFFFQTLNMFRAVVLTQIAGNFHFSHEIGEKEGERP